MDREANIQHMLFMSHVDQNAVISFVFHKSHSKYYHHFTHEYPEEDKHLIIKVTRDTDQF